LTIERVLIVGYGSIGRRHLQIARKLLPLADIRVVSKSFAPIIPPGANDIFPEIDAATEFFPHLSVISNPASQHIEVAMRLASIGSHLLIEKPISNNSSGVLELVNFCHANKLCIRVGYNLRFLKSLLIFKNEIESGVIGNVISLQSEASSYLPKWRPKKNYKDSVSSQKKLGGGVLLELSHEIDYLRWIFGEILWVNGVVGRYSDLNIDVEDGAMVVLGLKSVRSDKKIIGTLRLEFYRQDPVRSCVAVGEFGSIKWDGISGLVTLFKNDETQTLNSEQDGLGMDETYISEWNSFLKQVQDGDSSKDYGLDALKTLQVIESIKISSECQGLIHLG
jgi:predicted dehydrogenase